MTLQEPEIAVRELDLRVMNDLKLKGVEILTNVDGRWNCQMTNSARSSRKAEEPGAFSS